MAVFFLVDRPRRSPRARRRAARRFSRAQRHRDGGSRQRGLRARPAPPAIRASSPSPIPPSASTQGVCEGGGAGPGYRECWDRYWAWAQSDDFKDRMVEMVAATAGLPRGQLPLHRAPRAARRDRDQRLQRHRHQRPRRGHLGQLHLVDLQDAAAARRGHGPSPGLGRAAVPRPLGNGRGYIRPASLVSLWSTAPYLLNNSVGHDG